MPAVAQGGSYIRPVAGSNPARSNMGIVRQW